MKIAELERVSGVHRSTIHHYLNIGLLPRPRVEGPKLHRFGDDHVARLREIQALRDRGWSLPRIREHLGRLAARRTTRRVKREVPDGVRGQILQTATRLFAERGYHGVRLTDVAKVLGIGKATIYRYFTSKQSLFVECVEQVRFALVPKDVRASAERDLDLVNQGESRSLAVLHNFATYRTLNNLLSSLAHGTDIELASRARAELHAMITNAEPYLKKLLAAKLIRPCDTELLAYMTWGALMGAGERLLLDDRYRLEDVLEAYLTFTSWGTRGTPRRGSGQ